MNFNYCVICGAAFINYTRIYTICTGCYEGMNNIIHLAELDSVHIGKQAIMADVLKWIKEEQIERISFLSEFASAFREQKHTDILVHPGDGGSPIPAHRALLASKSKIFEYMLEGDGYKVPAGDCVTFPDLNSEELECLLEFLYSGGLPPVKAQAHVSSLWKAADKYGISFLQQCCEKLMLASLDPSNVLQVLETIDHTNVTLKETALEYIVKNRDSVLSSHSYDEFALRNPHLVVEITRALTKTFKGK